jgi:hypothetical protein
MNGLAADGTTDPLTFWGNIAPDFKILSRFAARTFATSACSSDVERLFSHAGDVCSPDRASLNSSTINMLTTLNMWLRDKLRIEDKRNKKSQEGALKFAFLNAALETESPTNMEEQLDELFDGEADYGGDADDNADLDD